MRVSDANPTGNNSRAVENAVNMPQPTALVQQIAAGRQRRDVGVLQGLDDLAQRAPHDVDVFDTKKRLCCKRILVHVFRAHALNLVDHGIYGWPGVDDHVGLLAPVHNLLARLFIVYGCRLRNEFVLISLCI